MNHGSKHLRGRTINMGGWKERATCRAVVRDKVRFSGWSYERAQRYVTNAFFGHGNGPPLGPEGFDNARLWCSTCPVQAECLAEALANGDDHAFRAGYTPVEIRALLKRRRRLHLLDGA